MYADLQFSGPRSAEIAIPAVVLFVASNNEGKRYLFNCSESSQRVLMAHNVRIMRMSEAFVTRVSWDCLGGLPGMLVTLRDGQTEMKNQGLRIHGGRNINHFLATTRHFILHNSLSLVTQEYTDECCSFTDEHLSIFPVPITPSPPSRKRSHSENDQISPNTTVHCYIIKFHSRRGKMDAKKANLLGAKRQQLGALCRGEIVTLENGTVIHPEQVLGPQKEGESVFIVDCPNDSYISSLVKNEKWKTFQPAYIVHLAETVSNPEYKEWINLFPHAQHLFSGPSGIHSINLNDAARYTFRLHNISPCNFPLPYSSNSLPNGHVKAGYQYRIEPSRIICKSPDYEPPLSFEILNIKREKKLALAPKQCWSNAKQVREKIESIKSPANAHNVEIVCIGTGSAMPSRYRNVSCTMIKTDSFGILLDVGEGTLGQLLRMYGPHADSVISLVKMIWISHLHADHHLGTVGIIKRWMKLVPQGNLFILGPLGFWRWLRDYNQMEDIALSRILFINAADIRKQSNRSSPMECSPFSKTINACFDQLSLTVTTCKVNHCPWAYGIAISHNSGWKIVYSGDSMPCAALVDIGQNADLLIHEATFEDNLKEEAVEKHHSTASEAVEIGRKMNAKFTLLTHFSQRYPKVSRFKGNVNNVGIAFDGLRFKLGESARLQVMREVIEEVEDEIIERGPIAL